ncbi:MAG: hypothetical protein OEM27_04250 [Nitrospinota bacterium]|nr:hypothetical protein [Nitrospinota bacterium]
MKRLLEKPINFVLMTLFFGMIISTPMGMVSVADAHHKPGHDCQGGGSSGCGGGPPPTVSELPIKYMVAGGLAIILLSGGIFYLTRDRSKQQSSEV